MNPVIKEFYLYAIRKETEKLEQGKFTGNVKFQINFKEGEIKNMNVGLEKSLMYAE